MPNNEWASDARHVPWYDIEPKGYEAVKYVDGQLMGKEEYDLCDFRVDGDGYWRASLQGLERFGRLREQRKQERKSAWKARVDAEDEYSAQMTALIEEKKP